MIVSVILVIISGLFVSPLEDAHNLASSTQFILTIYKGCLILAIMTILLLIIFQIIPFIYIIILRLRNIILLNL